MQKQQVYIWEIDWEIDSLSVSGPRREQAAGCKNKAYAFGK